MTASGKVIDKATRSCSLPVDHDAPTAPLLDATAASTTSVDLSWEASSDDIGVTAYVVHRDGRVIATLDAGTLGYADAGLDPGASYDYIVRARDAAGHATRSNTVSVMTPT